MKKFTSVLEKDFTADPSKYPQGWFKDKVCSWCGNVFKPTGPSHKYCSDPCRKEVYSDRTYRSKYGVGLSWVKDKLEERGWVCAICKTEGFKMREDHVTGMNLDHCHKTGKARGLLCHNCNRALGLMQDSEDILMSAVDYLRRSKYDV